MVTKPLPLPDRVWPVHTWIPDEHEGDILSTTDDHFDVVTTFRTDVKTHAARQGLPWLVRADAQIRYPREDGSIGSLYPDLLVAHEVEVAGPKPYEFLRVGKPPELLVEILSKETVKNDLDAVRGKLRVYAEMGVFEYLTFDPRPRKKLELRGYRLVAPGTFAPIAPAPEGGIWLESIRLRVVAEPANRTAKLGPRLRLYTETGERLLHPDEEAAAHLQERQARQQAEQQRQQAELAQRRAERASRRAEQARVLAERERLAEQQARQQAEHARFMEQEARQQAERERLAERQARQHAEQERNDALAELARLRALRESKPDPPS